MNCKLCASPLGKEINKRLRGGETQPGIRNWLASQGVNVGLRTLTRHKQHAFPRESFVEQVQRNPEIRKVSGREVTDAIMAVGMRNIADDPSQVRVTHTLKAAQIDAQRKNQQQDVLLAWAKVLTGNVLPKQPEQIEGEWVEEDPFQIEAEQRAAGQKIDIEERSRQWLARHRE